MGVGLKQLVFTLLIKVVESRKIVFVLDGWQHIHTGGGGQLTSRDGSKIL